MTGELTHEDGQDGQEDNYTFGQTNPLGLTDYNGNDHRGKVKMVFDEDTLPSDADDEVADDMNWAIRAVNAVIHQPNLTLWIRTKGRDLILAYEPADDHERAGHVRAATFRRSGATSVEFNTSTEIDAGLLTPFDAVNVLYDVIVGASYGAGYSMVLMDVMYVEMMFDQFTHPILSFPDGMASWGRHQHERMSFPSPRDRDRTAFPERAYRGTKHDEEHTHAAYVLDDHVGTFELK